MKPPEIIKKLYNSTARQHALFSRMLPYELKNYSIAYYLLYRIIDTVEDSDISFDIKTELLEKVSENFIEGIGYFCREFAKSQNILPVYKNLLAEFKIIIDFHLSFNRDIREIIEQTGMKMAAGMLEYLIKFKESSDKREKCFIKDFKEFNTYCYYAAGCVGELNTRLFRYLDTINTEDFNETIKYGIDLGNYLQIVNIIRDYSKDKLQKNKTYFPYSISSMTEEKQLMEIICFARSKEDNIERYLDKITSKKVRIYCSTLFNIAKCHIDFYSMNPVILEKQIKPPFIQIYKLLPLKLKIFFLIYKLKKM